MTTFNSQSTLHFWFEELTAKQHLVKEAALDETIRARFGDTLAIQPAPSGLRAEKTGFIDR